MYDTDTTETVTLDLMGVNHYETFGVSLDEPVEPGQQLHWSDLYRKRGGWYDDEQRLVAIPHATWGDYSGSTVERSNQRVLADEYPDHVITVGYSGHDGVGAFLLVGQEIPETLADVIRGLRDYPVVSDDDLTELESELEMEDLESWALRDWIDDEHDDLDELLAAYWALRGEEEVTWYAETATSGYFEAVSFEDRDRTVGDLVRAKVDEGRA